MDKFNKAVDRLIANGFVFKGASGTTTRNFEKVTENGIKYAYVFMSGAVRYK